MPFIAAERPVLYMGGGVVNSGAAEALDRFCGRVGAARDARR
ncbi:MAG: hypothetical protein WKF84_15340 [Pyrinomonadaceae bacterium]